MLAEPRELSAALVEVWRSIPEACRGLTEAEWHLATACPGWTVKDNLSHLINGLHLVVGRAQATVEVPDLPHVEGRFGVYMEQAVHERRDRSGDEVLAEFEALAAEATTLVEGLADADWDDEVLGPLDSRIVRHHYYDIMVFDFWAHGQDIRRAVDRPGHLTGPVAEHARDRIAVGLGHVLGAVTDETTETWVTFDVTGPSARRFSINVAEQPGLPVPEAPIPATLTVTLPFEAFVAKGCGRDVDGIDGQIVLSGDRTLGERVLAHLSVTP